MQHPWRVGLDIGSVNVKCVLLEDVDLRPRERGAWCLPSQGRPLHIVSRLLGEALRVSGGQVQLGVTGSGKELVPGRNGERVNEVVAVAAAVAASHPEIRTIIDIGGQFTKWILVDPTARGRPGRVEDFALNGMCAAGSGAFLEQQAGRLKLDLEELGRLAATAARGATIAGRCSVFAKSDMIHLQQKGTPVDEIAYGLCLALARTFVATVLKGRTVEPPVALVGGGAANGGLVRAFAQVLGLDPGQIVVPTDHLTIGARGAALGGATAPAQLVSTLLADLRDRGRQEHPPTSIEHGSPKVELTPLAPVAAVEGEALPEDPGTGGSSNRAFMGVDVGSVSTNVVLLDEEQRLLLGIYLPTRGRPVAVLAEAMAQIEERFPELELLGVGTTGSGRYLAEQLLGADLVKNEITAQLVSAAHYVPNVDTIIEIGGQDSKFIDAHGGQLRDFEMNKICAAGTGSFLEEQAERLGIQIKGEFAEHALQAARPKDLGTRCTVFMDTELCRAQAQGTPVSDICAGLAYSVARNYLDKVVAGRPIGDTVVFQGGTASNGAVVAAFNQLLGRRIRVHPYNRISGAIGMALLAARDAERRGEGSAFRGLDSCREHTLTSFECKRCENRCQVNRVRAGGRTAHFGDVCERFTSLDRRRRELRPARPFPELFGERAELLAEHLPRSKNAPRPRVGLPLASFHLELLPLWSHLLDQLGFEPVVSAPSTGEHLARGVRGLPPDVCLPLKLTNGHVRQLLDDEGVWRVFLPTLMALEARQPDDRPFVCPYAHEAPYMMRMNERERLVTAQVNLQRSPEARLETTRGLAEALGVSHSAVERALEVAVRRQREFDGARRALGRRCLEAGLERGVVVLGKPYNLHDPFANLNLARHLERLSIPAIPMDLLPTGDEPLDALWNALPWHANRDQVRALNLIKDQKGLFPILVSNFGCGPDAFTTKHLERVVGDRPRLFLEFDEHRGEAGLVTRLEAFVDEIAEYQRAQRRSTPGTRVFRELMPNRLTRGPRRRVFLHNFYGHSHVFAGALRALGHESVILPLPDEESARLGEEVCSGRECHPYILLAGEVERLLRSGRVRKHDVLYAPGTTLPCLMPQYADAFRILADQHNAPLTFWDPHVGEMLDAYGIGTMTRLYEGLTAVDFLITIGCQLRPRELVLGSVDDALSGCFWLVQDSIAHHRDTRDAFAECLERLEAVKLGPALPRPLVGVTGDLYSRINRIGNADLYRKLEELGCTVWPSPFFGGSPNFEMPGNVLRAARRGELKEAASAYGYGVLMRGRARRLADLLSPELRERCEDAPGRVMHEHAAQYCGPNTLHLVRGVVAKMVDFSRRGAAGVISAAGLNCMVGVSASAAIPAIREAHGNIPIVALAFGSNEGPAQQIQLETFAHQVHQHFAERRNPTRS
ncbi:MAG: acyl-CoA dehydratase activase [bacterium]